jgi:uracil phosphoribosyltransferase
VVGVGPRLLVVDHPVVADRMCRLRDKTTSSAEFRQLAGEISTFVAYEALRDLATGPRTIETPLASTTAGVVTETVLLVPVLRAGLGMVPAIQSLLPLTEVAHVGLRRDEVTWQSEVYLNRLPANLSGRRVIVCDPMLATGGSLVQVCDLVVEREARDVTALCLIASRPGLDRFHARHPEIPVACAAVDPELDERAYIVPGLGDAGDRLFGPPD